MVFGGICQICLLVTCMMHSLEANNKLINGKSKWEPRMEGAGEKSCLGFIFTSAASVILFPGIFLGRFGGHYVNYQVTGNNVFHPQ